MGEWASGDPSGAAAPGSEGAGVTPPSIPISDQPPPPSPYAPPGDGATAEWPMWSPPPGSAQPTTALPTTALPSGVPPLPSVPPVPGQQSFGAEGRSLPGYPTAGEGRGPAPWRPLFVVFTAFAVLFGSGFAVFALARPEGASSPEEAVRLLFAALDQEDAAGVVEVLPPSERGVIKQPVLDIVSELQRLGLLKDLSVEQVPGADLQVRNLELSEEPVGANNDLKAVRITGGTIVTRTVPDAVPIGPTLKAIIEDDFGETIKIDDHSDTENLAKDDLRLITVNENGGWHVSLFYSIAEAARNGKGAAPVLGGGPAPVGADTPDGALRGLVDGAVALDLRKVITMLPPDEARAAYDYAPLFLPDVGKEADRARKDGFTATVSKLETSVEGDGDTRRVKVTAFAFEGGTDKDHQKVSWDGTCLHTDGTYSYPDYSYGGYGGSTTGTYVPSTSYSSPGQESTHQSSSDFCPADPGRNRTGDQYSSFYSDLGLFNGLTPDVAVVVVQRDGKWYVSPVRTMFDSVLTALRKTTPEQLREWAKKTAEAEKNSRQRFEAVGEAIGGGDSSPGGTVPGTTSPPRTLSTMTVPSTTPSSPPGTGAETIPRRTTGTTQPVG